MRNDMPLATSPQSTYPLGNNREVVDAKGVVQQVTNYYPFDAEFCDNSTKSYVQNHKYNGKEFDNMHGLNTYDYGARQYNPVTGRWDRMDLLCEADYGVSPYSYCNNSPINAVDPDGNFTVFINEFRPWAWDIAYKNAL
jgi:RHS repeat-associated protein